MKVLVGMCTGGTVQAQTAVSLVGALDHLKIEGISYQVSIQIGGNKSQNMNRLVREAIQGEFDYLMSIDNDMIFPPDGIVKLINNDKDIVGANYAVRGNSVEGDTRECVIKIVDDKGKKMATTLNSLPKHLFQCHSLGNGFTLYKTEVFKKLQAPWFKDYETKDGEWHGEDVLFAEDAQKQGYEVWCNPKIKIGHIGKYNYQI